MLPASARLPALFLFLATALGFTVASARAELVWTPQSGWRVEGGALSGLSGAEGRNALEQMNKARSAEEAGSRRSAVRAYAAIAKKYPNSVYAPEALYRSARLRLAGRDFNKAFEDFQQVLGKYPNTPRFNEIVGEQYRIASALLDGARGRMMWGMLPGFTQRDKALEFFETILVNAPYSDYAPLSLMNIARGHQKLGNIEDAIDALDRMINNYSQSLLAPDAYLKLAQTHASLVDGPFYDQGSTKESITYFTDFMLLFPSDGNIAAAEKGLDGMKTMLAESKIKIADFYFYKRSNLKAARVFYNEAITAYPESAIANRAKARLAEVEAKANNQPPPAAAPGEAPKKKRFFFF
ncbi:MAG: outer membrane protein assembly factor BamD [Opitutia bacterium Tous-C1TDCM]|nr:MAG: outer membrane protein assembly factor BamD [Opitutae bacterium Tous-C1TDCM]